MLQYNSEEERAYLGLIQKMYDPGIEEVNTNAPSDVEKFKIIDIPTIIWEVLEHYSDIFLSELPKDVPPTRMGHQLKIDLEDEAPPIHRPLCKIIPPELEEAKK